MATEQPDRDRLQAMYIKAVRQNWGPLIGIVGDLVEEINQAGIEWYRQLETSVREFESLLAADKLDELSPDQILQAALLGNPSWNPGTLFRWVAERVLEAMVEGEGTRLNQLEEQAREAASQALHACLAAAKEKAKKAVDVAVQEARRQMWGNLFASAMALPLELASSGVSKSLPKAMEDKMSDITWRETIEGKLRRIKDEARTVIQQAFDEGKESLHKEIEQQTRQLEDTYAELSRQLYSFIRQVLR